MPEALQIALSVGAGFFALPFGLLPSIFLFRDLANGTDATERTKTAYAWTLWTGLAAAWAIGSLVAYGLLELVFG